MREEQGEQIRKTNPLACGLTLVVCRTRIAKTRRQAAFKCFGRNDLPLLPGDGPGGICWPRPDAANRLRCH